MKFMPSAIHFKGAPFCGCGRPPVSTVLARHALAWQWVGRVFSRLPASPCRAGGFFSGGVHACSVVGMGIFFHSNEQKGMP
jgi:hypothetical protein